MITLAGIRIIAAFVLAYLLPAFLRNRRCPEPGEGWVRLVHGFAVTAEAAPFFGTSAFATQSRAFKTTLRWLSLPQLACVWPPVKPKPRPPFGRS